MPAGGPSYSALNLSTLKTGKESLASGEKTRPLYQGKITELRPNTASTR